VFTDRDDGKRRETTLLCALGVRYKFGTTEGEKEWLSGFYATPNEALGFFDFVVGIQEVGGAKPLASTTLSLLASIIYAAFADAGFWTIFGTFGTTEGNSNPNPHRSAQVLRNPTSSLILS
jgi:hypothetical protein